jgi:hypothetical protein
MRFHEFEQIFRVLGRESHAAMRCWSAERADVARAMDGVCGIGASSHSFE